MFGDAENFMSNIIEAFPLGPPPWPTLDPFLFCVHHNDDYPAGSQDMSPNASLYGRNIGSDFSQKDGWSMYHGDSVPGFPRHPHRGFETVTIARRGYIDHSDSLGATARFGHGDCQWMTAGAGVVHSEMFPLVNTDKRNPTELFQIWLNLPQKEKMVPPYFTMLWKESIPFVEENNVRVDIFAGRFRDKTPPPPPPNSWAAQTESDIAIWSLTLKTSGTITLPPSKEGTNRTLYCFLGEEIFIDDTPIPIGYGLRIRPNVAITITNNKSTAEILLLQAKPLNEPVAKHGPFVMNTHEEIRQAIIDYQRTGFGGWPWKRKDPVHNAREGRFAIHADGRKEHKG